MSQLEQLNYILHALCGGVKAEMQRRLGMNSPNTLQGWFKRGSYDARRVYEAFSELNPIWVLTGEGLPFKDDCRKYGIPVLDDIDPNAPSSDTAVHGSVSSSDTAVPGGVSPSSDAAILGVVSPSKQPSSPTYPDTPDTTYHIQEGEPVDRAFVNVLLQQVSTLTQQVAMLQAQNLQLNIDKATLEERMRGAANWFHEAVAKHPDLKPTENKKG